MAEHEPWLRGPLAGVPAHLMPILFSFQQVREDLAKFTSDITYAELWHAITGKHSLGYQLKHIAGSVDRLSTYLAGRQLTSGQLTFLDNEHTANAELHELLALISARLDASEKQVFAIKEEDLFERRVVGRQQLPSSVMGLLVHLCEHTQRHLGQAILLAKILRQE